MLFVALLEPCGRHNSEEAGQLWSACSYPWSMSYKSRLATTKQIAATMLSPVSTLVEQRQVCVLIYFKRAEAVQEQRDTVCA